MTIAAGAVPAALERGNATAVPAAADRKPRPLERGNMNNSTPDFHPIYTVAKTAIEQMGGQCLAMDAAAGAANVLLDHWGGAIRDWSETGPTGPEVERMITGDIRDCIDQMEELLRRIERREQ